MLQAGLRARVWNNCADIEIVARLAAPRGDGGWRRVDEAGVSQPGYQRMLMSCLSAWWVNSAHANRSGVVSYLPCHGRRCCDGLKVDQKSELRCEKAKLLDVSV